MERCSFSKSDGILDVSFDAEEVEHALKCLKLKWSGGPDNLLPEHLRYCGPCSVFEQCITVSVISNKSPNASSTE